MDITPGRGMKLDIRNSEIKELTNAWKSEKEKKLEKKETFSKKKLIVIKNNKMNN